MSGKSTYLKVVFITSSIICATFITTSFAEAKSILWNQTYSGYVSKIKDGTFCSALNVCTDRKLYFQNPVVSVEYRAHVENLDIGTLVPDGSIIPVGTRVKLVFESHVYNDISWFAAGGAFDSPFGEWRIDSTPPPIACNEKDFVVPDTKGSRQGDIYSSLVVSPPAKSVNGISNLSCDAPKADGSRTCVAENAGAVNPIFMFGDTEGKFYPRFKASKNINVGGQRFSAGDCLGSQTPMAIGAQAEDGRATDNNTISVAAQNIPASFIVSDETTGEPPAAPTIFEVSGACVVGTPYAISFTATDPDGDNIRYGADWNGDGTVDQFVPPTGYISSGVARQASRTYSTAGNKNIQVLAQDENGNISSWSTHSFSCTQQTLEEGQSFNEASFISGDGRPHGGEIQFVNTANANLVARPSLVRSGESTRLEWTTSNIVSCVVSAPNGDSWSETSGTRTSRPIEAQTTYTLICEDENGGTLTDSATVNILPTWQEV